jgi:hypothetical protein
MTNLTLTLPWILEPDFTKTDALATYGVDFGHSIYGWNQNFIELPMEKFVLSQHKSSTQVGVQNLSGCCVTVCWAVGPCTVFASRVVCKPLTPFYSVAITTLVFGFCLDSIYHRTVSPFIGL